MFNELNRFDDMNHRRYFMAVVLSVFTTLIALMSFEAYAHGVDENTREFLLQNGGVQIVPFLYIGAKHMVTGYDHLLFLVGVLFFLQKSRDVLLYVSMFTIGHSITLLYGVLSDIQINAYLIDAIIGLSVVYKGFDNIGGFKKVIGFSPNAKAVVLVFGLFHGFGLATKLQELQLSTDGLVANLIAFNVGVELGQFMALALVLLLLNFCRTWWWSNQQVYWRFTLVTNGLLMSAGFMLIGMQLTGYFIS